MVSSDKATLDELAKHLVITVLVEAKSQEGEDFFAFINMTKDSFEQFTFDAAEQGDEPFNIAQYGQTIFCSMGKPNDAIKEAIATMFGYDINHTLEIQRPTLLHLEQSDDE